MSNARLFRLGRMLLFVGLAILVLGILLKIRHWPAGAELLLTGQVVSGAGLVILIIQLFIPKKKNSFK